MISKYQFGSMDQEQRICKPFILGHKASRFILRMFTGNEENPGISKRSEQPEAPGNWRR